MYMETINDTEENTLNTAEDYYNLPDNVRAELIKGKFYNMAAPTRKHQHILTELINIIYDHIKSKNGDCKVYPAPFSVQLNEKSVVEPDITVICDKDKLTERGCTGGPDWIIEIVSPSNSANDYIRKSGLYYDAGVREYWIVDPIIEKVIVYDMTDKITNITIYTFNDTVRSNIYDDLYIDFSSVLDSYEE